MHFLCSGSVAVLPSSGRQSFFFFLACALPNPFNVLKCTFSKYAMSWQFKSLCINFWCVPVVLKNTSALNDASWVTYGSSNPLCVPDLAALGVW